MVNQDQHSQQELRPLLGMVRTRPQMVDWNLIAKCADEQAALQLCVQCSRLANEEIALQLGIDKGHWTRIMQGRGNLPARKRTQLMSICGNLAPLQYDSLKFGFKLSVDDTEEEKRLLRERLKQIEAQEQMRMAS